MNFKHSFNVQPIGASFTFHHIVWEEIPFFSSIYQLSSKKQTHIKTNTLPPLHFPQKNRKSL